MMGKTHMAAGALTAVATYNIIHIAMPYEPRLSFTIALTASCLLGALAPDIDEPNSVIGRLLWFVSIPYYMLGLLLRIVGKVVMLIPVKHSDIIYKLGAAFKHRHMAHKKCVALIPIALAVPLYYCNRSWSIYMLLFGINVMIHILLYKILPSVL